MVEHNLNHSTNHWLYSSLFHWTIPRSSLVLVIKTSLVSLLFALTALLCGVVLVEGSAPILRGGEQPRPTEDQSWIEDIEKVFIPSEQCKQCHDRHFEEWKGMRERTEDLKSFGRVDGALLHGTALKSEIFKTVLGLWLETNPNHQQRNQCLSCHAPAVTVFPQHTDRIIQQVMKGPKHVAVEGIGCTSCHLINAINDNGDSYPTFKLDPGLTFYGSYAGAKDNLVHSSKKSKLYDGASYCTPVTSVK